LSELDALEQNSKLRPKASLKVQLWPVSQNSWAKVGGTEAGFRPELVV
jgi:hypothetical protein